MNKYPIPDNTILREVYLMWLIAINPQELLEEHGLNSMQVMAMRNYTNDTWKDFNDLRRA